MKLFPKEADYAIRTLIFLAMKEEPGARSKQMFSATVLSEELGIPLHFLRRICSTLIKAGLLEAKEGVGGGVRFERDPASINVLDVMTLFRGELELSDCTFRKALCANRDHCVLRKRILGIRDKVKEEFRSITIRDLIDDITG